MSAPGAHDVGHGPEHTMAPDFVRTLRSVHGERGRDGLRVWKEDARERGRKQAGVVASEDDGRRASC